MRVLTADMSRGYRAILESADAHFARVAASEGASIACRRGCSLCCHGLFEISAADVSMVAAALEAATPAVRERMIDRSRRILETAAAPDLRNCSAEEKEAFFDRTEGVPCPALDAEGACSIYEDRPLVCRTFGLPLRDGPRYMGEECELNFTGATADQKEAAAWDLAWEDVLGPEDEYTVPEAILLAHRMRSR